MCNYGRLPIIIIKEDLKMAQIDMDKIKKPVQNSTELKESEHVKQAETPAKPVELIDNATEGHEDNNETDKETEPTKAVVRYVGSGVWKDAKKELWSNENRTRNIVNERTYSVDEYNEREDIKFMVGYGAMQVTFV